MAMPFRTVDVAAQAKAYKLAARGAQDGVMNRPETISDLPELAEQEIITAIHADRDRCLIDLTAHLRAERDALAQLQTAMDIAGMRLASDEAVADFAMLTASYAGSLAQRRQRAASAAAEYDEFRARYRIVRDARQPTNRSLSLALMAFLIVFEGIINAVFFASGSDLGLLGGALLAAAFSAVNVGAAALNGWFPLRWAHHRGVAVKLAGIVAFPALCAASVALNGFVAHYRDIAQASPEVPPLLAAYAGLLRTPFELQSIESWFLLGLGVSFAGAAIAKGYHLDDPHPGYGAHDRRRLASRDEYEDIRRQVIDHASEVRDEFTSKLHEKIATLRGSSSQRQHLLASRARNLSEFEAHEGHLAQAATQLLCIYRQANEAARSTASPVRFGQNFDFRDHATDSVAVRSLLEDQGLEVDAERLIEELDGLRRAVLTRYEAALGEPVTGSSP